jgi:hypothetical protein
VLAAMTEHRSPFLARAPGAAEWLDFTATLELK